jgi:glycogen debranching enzyme
MSFVRIRPDVLYAWRGSSLLIVNTRGESGDDVPLGGFYYREARFLRELRFEVNGNRPWLCESSMVDRDRLEFVYVYPEVANYGGGGSGQANDDEPRDERGIAQRALNIRLTYRVRAARLEATATIDNRAREPVSVEAVWRLSTDFADIQEAQSGTPEQRGHVVVEGDSSRVEFRYDHPSLAYRTIAALPARSLRLEPLQQVTLTLTVDAVDGTLTADAERDAREQHLASWRAGFATITTPGNGVFEDALRVNVDDYASFPMLEGPRDEWLVPQAGMPLYPACFGRDAVTAGWQAAMLDRGALLEASLTKLGRRQSTRVDDWRDEEPGRIPYQIRDGPLARLNINPYSAYYADYASPLMYVISLANLFAWTGDERAIDAHWDTAWRILDWARTRGDLDGDGYLEYRTRSSKGTKNQGWKDSGDAIIYDDGSPVPAPIATCEVQGYWYAAQLLMGVLCWLRGRRTDASALMAAARDLKTRFNRDWWIEEENCVALALDPEKRPVRAVTSNVGHCIAAGIIDADHLPRVVGRLFAPDMFSGWGIRTLSSSHAYYNPLSYHRGSVWAVEQATIVFGLRRFGFDARASDLATAVFDLARLYPGCRIPETVGGEARAGHATPGAYPQANTPQLWNATAFPLIVQSLLGLLPFAPYRSLVIDPALPPWLPEVIVRGLRVGDASVSLRCWRDGEGSSHFDVLHQQGTLHVLRQPPPESLTATVTDRMYALGETLLRRAS